MTGHRIGDCLDRHLYADDGTRYRITTVTTMVFGPARYGPDCIHDIGSATAAATPGPRPALVVGGAMSDYESFRHEVGGWTVGQLRASLDGVPDDWPVRVLVAEDPGENWMDDQVVTGAWSEGTGKWFDIG